MGHDCYQIDVVVAHGFRNLRRGFAGYDYRFNLESIKQRIGQQLAHVGAQLQQPAVVLLGENALRERQQVGRNISALHAEKYNTAAAAAGKGRRILQGRPGMRSEISREENASERIHGSSNCKFVYLRVEKEIS